MILSKSFYLFLIAAFLLTNELTAQNYTMPFGTISTCSGNFYDPGGAAGNYSDDVPSSITSTITSTTNDQIIILWISMTLEGNDKLFVYDGPDNTYPLVKTYTNAPMAGNTVRSTGTSLTFELVTDGNGMGAAGWSGMINCITMPDASYNLNSSGTYTIGCDVRNDFFDEGGYNGRYPSNGQTRITTYKSESGNRLLFHLNLFSTSILDTLYIYDGNSTSAPLIGAFKGFNPGFVFTSSSDVVTLKFVENGDGITGEGWVLTATCVKDFYLDCDQPFLFHDPAGPSKIYFTSWAGERFQTTFHAPAGKHVEAKVSNFFTSIVYSRKLLVYDGPDANSPLIGTFSGTDFPPFNLSSSGTSLTFILETGQNSWWRFNYDIEINCTDLQLGSSFTIGGSSSPMNIPCNTPSKIFDLGGRFYYPENFQVPSPYIQTYVAPPGNYIKIEFSELNIGDTGDRINIYDGNSTSSPLIATFTSNNNPATRNPLPPVVVSSSSNIITLELKTDHDMTLSDGFEAEISCIPLRQKSNFSLGNSAQPVNVVCDVSSTFEDWFGARPYNDFSIQQYITTYYENTGRPLYYTFTNFRTGAGDTLYIYNGSNTSAPLLGKYSGNLGMFSAGSENGILTFEFKTNGTDNFGTNGWHANITCSDPLPVELLYFKGELINKTTLLEWATASEKNNDYFIIEKSDDGNNFSEMATIQGSKDSKVKITYNYLDANPYIPTTYYRLKQTDMDGSTNISPVISVTNNDLPLVNLHLQHNYIQLQTMNLENQEIFVRVADTKGHIVHISENLIPESSFDFQIPTSSLAAGMYFVTVSTSEKIITTKKIIK
ncbi:MAG: T9SS type A sorting domain-containing protein [Cytophagaceae bacterium]